MVGGYVKHVALLFKAPGGANPPLRLACSVLATLLRCFTVNNMAVGLEPTGRLERPGCLYTTPFADHQQCARGT